MNIQPPIDKKQNAPRELSVITKDWLSSINIKVNSSYAKDAIITHPDYPALTALTDFLETGGMGYDAVQANASYIHEFNYPLLAHIKQTGNEYLHLIKDATVWDKEKHVTENWSGIALYATKGATWHNEESSAADKIARNNKYLSAAFVIAGFALFICSVFILLRDNIFLKDVISVSSFGFLSFVGLAVSIAALGTELGYQSKLVKQVCGTVGNGGCEKVLGSKYAKGFAGITPADAAVLYFAAQFIMYLVGCFYNPLLNGIITIAFAGIAVAAWSIYTQAVKVKEWCALCLCIVAVLVWQFIIATYLHFNNELTSIIPNSQLLIPFTTFIITILLLTLIYLPIKQLIKTNTQNTQELRSFKKWKTDASLFITQWEKEPSCDNTIWENDLIIGNADAPIRITVACNPYCQPCAIEHKKLDALVDKYPDKICLQIRLICKADNETHSTTLATKAILKLTENDINKRKIIHDWFEIMDLDELHKAWPNKESFDVYNLMVKHENWMKENKITYTPTIFINTKRLPTRYSLKDVGSIVPQLANSFEVA